MGAGGETEPADRPTDPMPTQNPGARHVIASPNPTIDDGKPTTVEPGRVPGKKVRPATATTAAPMKPAAKPKRKRTKPRTQD